MRVADDTRLDIRALGPLQVDVDGRRAALGGPKQRCVLSLLALRANTTVSVDDLAAAVWGEDANVSDVLDALRVYLSNLRAVLDPGRSRGSVGSRLLREGAGYRLCVRPEELDVLRFSERVWRRSAVRRGRRTTAGGRQPRRGGAAVAWGRLPRPRRRPVRATGTRRPGRAAAIGDRGPDRGRAGTGAPNELIGRSRDLADVVERLRSGRGRVVTLVGTGGVGKTRLALAAASALEPEHAAGACWVPLAGLGDPDLVPQAVAAGLGLTGFADHKAASAIAQHLRAIDVLLVLDNFEHLLPAAHWLADLLAEVPGVGVVVTSRSPLGLSAELEVPVEPLPLPDPTTPSPA